jgi:hypothetical protein
MVNPSASPQMVIAIGNLCGFQRTVTAGGEPFHNLPVERGAFIGGVQNSSLLQGGVIVEFAGRAVAGIDSLHRLLAEVVLERNVKHHRDSRISKNCTRCAAGIARLNSALFCTHLPKIPDAHKDFSRRYQEKSLWRMQAFVSAPKIPLKLY